MVMMKSVVAKPSSTSTKILPYHVRKQPLQHGDGTLSVGAGLADAAVHRQSGKQRDQHQHKGRQRRQNAGRQKGDARLVSQRGKVVHAGQAHDAPPRILRLVFLMGRRNTQVG